MPFRTDEDMPDMIASANEVGDAGETRAWFVDREGAEQATKRFTIPPRILYDASIDQALADAECSPDGYLNLSAAESRLVSESFDKGVPALVVGEMLIRFRKEANLFNALKASVEIGELRSRLTLALDHLNRTANFVQSLPQREEHDAVLADLETLRQQINALNTRAAA